MSKFKRSRSPNYQCEDSFTPKLKKMEPIIKNKLTEITDFSKLDTGKTYLIGINNDAVNYTSDSNILPDLFFAKYHDKHDIDDSYKFNIGDDTKPNLIDLKQNDDKTMVWKFANASLPITLLNSFSGFDPKSTRYEVHPTSESVRSNVTATSRSNARYKMFAAPNKNPPNNGSSGGKTINRKHKKSKTKRKKC